MYGSPVKTVWGTAIALIKVPLLWLRRLTALVRRLRAVI
jgi:hypothetical protein